MPIYGFHSEAADEYLAATRYYLNHASPLVAAAFVAEIETAIETLLATPATWPVIEEPQIRRYLLRRFPYSLYYRWELEQILISIYAVMHFSRRPVCVADPTLSRYGTDFMPLRLCVNINLEHVFFPRGVY